MPARVSGMSVVFANPMPIEVVDSGASPFLVIRHIEKNLYMSLVHIYCGVKIFGLGK
jgi:hypothetical protein